MLFSGSVWPSLLFSCFLIKVNAQASSTNPFIWQILAQYDTSQSNTTKIYSTNTSTKVYSQDFQTVFAYKDIYGYNERLVLNIGDACNGTTIEDVQRLNGNLTTSPSMMSQPSIGLVQRGGRCLQWSEKIANVQSLSASYQLQLSGMIVYDNILYNDTTFINEDTNDMSYPTWSAPTLPTYRNISYMTQENVIDTGSTFLAVYFVPLSYINYLNQTMLQQSFQHNGAIQSYTQLTFELKETHFASTSGSGISGSPQSPSPTDPTAASIDSMTLENNKRNIIIYAVTAVIVVVLVYLVLRWCRGIRRHASQDVERAGVEGQNMLLTNLRTAKVIPFLELANVCPIQKYDKTTMTNTTCAICLEDFKDDILVRVLPCRHGYCTACIDVWLTKKSSLCPICKFDCRTVLNLDDEEVEVQANTTEEVAVEGTPEQESTATTSNDQTAAATPAREATVASSEEEVVVNTPEENIATVAPLEEMTVNTSEQEASTEEAVHTPNGARLPAPHTEQFLK